MAYEGTVVPVHKTQGKLSELIMRNGGTGVAFISQPPMEGFQAHISLDGTDYVIRISATLQGKQRDPEAERRRIWRVLYHHLKDIFEASNSGVIELREMILPYIVTKDGRTVAEHILPKLGDAITNPGRLLTTGSK